MEKLTSTANYRIKRLIRLSKSSTRKEENLIVIEGKREINMAIEGAISFEEFYICSEVSAFASHNEVMSRIKCPVFDISKKLFEKVAYRDNSDGLIAVGKPNYLPINELKLSRNPLILVLESVEKPGNLGAILRTADAAKIDAVLVCDPKTDIYNPNVIRSSLGCIFSMQVVCCTSVDAIKYFKGKDIKTYAASLTADQYYHKTDFINASAIIMGTEADGLTELWLKNSDFQIKIPMLGKVDSLNVSTSAAVLIFEALRQRGFKE